MHPILYRAKDRSEKKDAFGKFLRASAWIFNRQGLRRVLNGGFTLIFIPWRFLLLSRLPGTIGATELYSDRILWIGVGMYVVLNLGFWVRDVYADAFRQSFDKNKFFVKSIGDLFADWYERVTDLEQKIARVRSRQAWTQRYLEHADYGKRANFLAHLIYDYLERVLGAGTDQITIMHKFVDGSNSQPYLRFVGYKNKDNTPPGSHGIVFRFDDPNHRQYFHVKLFASNQRKIAILMTNDQIQDSFVIQHQNRDRERALQQYIGIPIIDDKDEMIALVNIDTLDKNRFGSSEGEVRYFAKHILLPMCSILKV